MLVSAGCFTAPDIDLPGDASSGTQDPSTSVDPTTNATTTDTPDPATTTGDTDPATTVSVDSSGGDACGDGAITGPEACDDANVDDGDGCSSTCALEPGFDCRGEPSVCTAECGNGQLDPTEDCDDANGVDDDGCTSCTIDRGFTCTDDRPSICTAGCGDGVVGPGEQCDDGDDVDGNGCSSECTVELYYRCVSEGPGSCTPISILYLVADVDDPAFRVGISGVTGGTTDYFAANTGTPTLPDLTANYDCILTHPQNSYMDPLTVGDHLANFVDFGGNVVLGIAVDIPEIGLTGSPIMAPGYAPMTTGDTVQFSMSQYSGDGTSVLHTGVVAYGLQVTDTAVALQGAGIIDATYTDGSIAVAYRPDFKVVYVNGTGHEVVDPTGDLPLLFANACAAGFVQ